MNFPSVLRSIFSLILIIWLANVMLKQLNKYTQKQAQSIEILERFSVTKNSSLAIVKIIESYYLMSFNDNSNEILKEFSVDEVEDILEVIQMKSAANPSQGLTNLNFTEIKEKYIKFFEKKED